MTLMGYPHVQKRQPLPKERRKLIDQGRLKLFRVIGDLLVVVGLDVLETTSGTLIVAEAVPFVPPVRPAFAGVVFAKPGHRETASQALSIILCSFGVASGRSSVRPVSANVAALNIRHAVQ